MRRDERVPAPEAGEAASLYPEVDTGRADWGEAEVRQRHVIMSSCQLSESFRFDEILQRFMVEFVAHRMSGTGDDGDFSEKLDWESIRSSPRDGLNLFLQTSSVDHSKTFLFLNFFVGKKYCRLQDRLI